MNELLKHLSEEELVNRLQEAHLEIQRIHHQRAELFCEEQNWQVYRAEILSLLGIEDIQKEMMQRNE